MYIQWMINQSYQIINITVIVVLKIMGILNKFLKSKILYLTDKLINIVNTF